MWCMPIAIPPIQRVKIGRQTRISLITNGNIALFLNYDK
jgi:hypothetical protein